MLSLGSLKSNFILSSGSGSVCGFGFYKSEIIEDEHESGIAGVKDIFGVTGGIAIKSVISTRSAKNLYRLFEAAKGSKCGGLTFSNDAAVLILSKDIEELISLRGEEAVSDMIFAKFLKEKNSNIDGVKDSEVLCVWGGAAAVIYTEGEENISKLKEFEKLILREKVSVSPGNPLTMDAFVDKGLFIVSASEIPKNSVLRKERDDSNKHFIRKNKRFKKLLAAGKLKKVPEWMIDDGQVEHLLEKYEGSLAEPIENEEHEEEYAIAV